MRPLEIMVCSLFVLAAGCAGNSGLFATDGSDASTTNPATCQACVMDSDCSQGVCAQVGGDSYCMSACSSSGGCDGTHTCEAVTTVSGDSTKVCTPNGNACGVAPQPPSNDGGARPPSDASITPDAAVVATIGPNGGTESTLYFAIIGDTRPAVIDDTKAYPTAVITKIFADVNALLPMPPFVVTTGDYMFASTSGSQSAAQLSLYTAARKGYSGYDFPAMGNHECTGATASNCGSGSTDGVTTNMTNFMSSLLAPISKTSPYYVINVASTTNAWTAKFVFVAANAWDSTQASWFDTALSTSTTYTFVIRHESATASTAPGVSPSEAIMKKHPYTMSIVGHAHTYSHPRTNEVLFGNGGAPLASGSYGYGLVTQRSDGAIQVDAVDYQSGAPDTSFRFALHADGTSAP